MSRCCRKRKPTKTWRVVPVRITPKLKKTDPIPRILRAFALTYTGAAPPSESDLFITTLNQHLTCRKNKLIPKILRTWEKGINPPQETILLDLLRNAPPLSWPWLLANDTLATMHPDRYQPKSIIALRLLDSSAVAPTARVAILCELLALCRTRARADRCSSSPSRDGACAYPPATRCLARGGRQLAPRCVPES